MIRQFLTILAIPAALALYGCSNPLTTSSAAGGAPTGAATPVDNGVAVDPADQLVAGFDFNQNITVDSPATLNGTPLPQWVTGLSGDALQFSGAGQYVFLPDSDSLDLSTAGTVEAWIYPIHNTNAAGFVHKGVNEDFSDEAYTLQYNYAGQPMFVITNTSGSATYLYDTTQVSENQWHHIVGTWDSTLATPTMSLYVDGVLKKTKTLPAGFTVRNTDGGLLIGQQVPGLDASKDFPFDGIIDDVNIFNRALSATEVANRYAALNP